MLRRVHLEILYFITTQYRDNLTFDRKLQELHHEAPAELLTHGWVRLPVSKIKEALLHKYSEKTLRRALDFLTAGGWLIREQRGSHPMDKTYSYRINENLPLDDLIHELRRRLGR